MAKMSLPDPTKTADAAAASSVILVAGLNLSQVNEIAQIVAAIAATVAGIAAAYYHLFMAPRREKDDGKQD
jgi:hypothetical protein